MKKPSGLRAAICAFDPNLLQDADRLRLWVDRGRGEPVPAPGLSFRFLYTLSVLIVETQTDPALYALAVNLWLHRNQPELCTGDARGGYPFEADILDDTTADLRFDIELNELVTVTPRADGGFDLTYVDEPPLLSDDLPLSDPAALLQSIWKDSTQIVPIIAPADKSG